MPKKKRNPLRRRYQTADGITVRPGEKVWRWRSGTSEATDTLELVPVAGSMFCFWTKKAAIEWGLKNAAERYLKWQKRVLELQTMLAFESEENPS